MDKSAISFLLMKSMMASALWVGHLSKYNKGVAKVSLKKALVVYLSWA